MPTSMPAVVEALLSASPEDEPAAWAAFVEAYSALVLHVARSLGGDRDAAMDRYVYVFERLRAEGARRLRGYAADGRGRFTTWLVVVARRLCLDQHRDRYGRVQGRTDPAARVERRALADLVGVELDASDPRLVIDPGMQAGLEEAEARAALRDAVGRLEAGDRLLLRLRFEEGLSVPEIARLTGGASAFALYHRIDKLLAQLRRELERVGVEARSA